MKNAWQRALRIAAGIACLIVVAGAGGCAHHGLEVDVMGDDGYSHRGYYDNDRYWHGGWYDRDRHYHEDPRDWRR